MKNIGLGIILVITAFSLGRWSKTSTYQYQLPLNNNNEVLLETNGLIVKQSDLSLLTSVQLWQNENQRYQILESVLKQKLGDWILQQDKTTHSMDVSSREIDKFIADNKIKAELVNDSLKERIKAKLQEQKLEEYRNQVITTQASKYKVSTGLAQPQLRLNEKTKYLSSGTGKDIVLAFYDSEDQLKGLIKQATSQDKFKVVIIPLINEHLGQREAIRHICAQEKNPEACLSGGIPLAAIRESGLIANLLGVNAPALVYQGQKYSLNLNDLNP